MTKRSSGPKEGVAAAAVAAADPRYYGDFDVAVCAAAAAGVHNTITTSYPFPRGIIS